MLGHLRRQPVRQGLGPQPLQGLGAELAQAQLGEAFGGRIDGRQRLLDRGGRAFVLGAVFGVVDLQAGGTGTHLAIAAQQGAAGHAILLRLAEVEESQRKGTAAILQPHQQAAPPSHEHFSGGDHAFHHGVLARPQGADGYDAGTVLIAQRQVEEHVLQGFQAHPCELFLQGRAYPLERGDRRRGQFAHAGCTMPLASGRATEHSRTESASTSMALGRGKLARQAMATVR